MAIVFFSYSHADEALRDRLETALAMLSRQGIVEAWHDRRIPPGDDFANAVDVELDRADIVLLLVSPDFLASRYCYEVEMQRALQRHDAGEARVIPVILRPCQWQDAPFGRLRAIPKDGRPVTKHADVDDAFLEIAEAIKSVAGPAAAPASKSAAAGQPSPALSEPRSSNLRLNKTFTEADKDRFLDEAFEYLAKFFENSLDELGRRNEGVETRFKRIDSNTFTSIAYRNGEPVARCRIFLGSPMINRGIAYSNDDAGAGNAFNESLSAVAEEQSIALQPLGLAMSVHGGSTRNLTMEGAAEAYWGLFIAPMQR